MATVVWYLVGFCLDFRVPIVVVIDPNETCRMLRPAPGPTAEQIGYAFYILLNRINRIP